MAVRDDLAAALRALEITQAELARRLHVHVNTVSAWATGKAPIPGPVRAYLDLAIRVKRLME